MLFWANISAFGSFFLHFSLNQLLMPFIPLSIFKKSSWENQIISFLSTCDLNEYLINNDSGIMGIA